MVLLWGERWNNFSLLISLDCRVLEELSDEWLLWDDFVEVAEVFQNDIEGFVFGGGGEQRSGVSSGDIISDGWGLVTFD